MKLKTTGEIIRHEREKKGLFLRQVATRLGMDTAILSKVERGERRATRAQIIKLAEILELKEEDLMINYISEKIAYELMIEENPKKVLKAVEAKVTYYNQSKK